MRTINVALRREDNDLCKEACDKLVSLWENDNGDRHDHHLVAVGSEDKHKAILDVSKGCVFTGPGKHNRESHLLFVVSLPKRGVVHNEIVEVDKYEQALFWVGNAIEVMVTTR